MLLEGSINVLGLVPCSLAASTYPPEDVPTWSFTCVFDYVCFRRLFTHTQILSDCSLTLSDCSHSQTFRLFAVATGSFFFTPNIGD